jgi:hypothetical protein
LKNSGHTQHHSAPKRVDGDLGLSHFPDKGDGARVFELLIKQYRARPFDIFFSRGENYGNKHFLLVLFFFERWEGK